MFTDQGLQWGRRLKKGSQWVIILFTLQKKGKQMKKKVCVLFFLFSLEMRLSRFNTCVWKARDISWFLLSITWRRNAWITYVTVYVFVRKTTSHCLVGRHPRKELNSGPRGTPPWLAKQDCKHRIRKIKDLKNNERSKKQQFCCYFVTSTWELKSLVLETFGFKKDHMAENIAASFQKIAEEWGISRKVAMVTDNAANVVAAVRDTGWIHVPCSAYALNLVVSEEIKAYTKIHQLRKSCKDIVSFFHHSVKASAKLKEIQLQLGIPENKLIQEVETR